MDLKSIAEAYQSIQEGKVNAGLQAYLDKKKGKKENGEEKEEENGKESKGSKPDFLDLDKDGDKKEPMKKAAKEKKEETEYNYVNAYLGELKKTSKEEETEVVEHHQKDAEGKVIEHEEEATGTPSSVEEEKTVLEQLAENGKELDMFEVTESYMKKSAKLTGRVILHYGGARGSGKRLDIHCESSNYKFMFNLRNKQSGLYPSHIMCDYKKK